MYWDIILQIKKRLKRVKKGFMLSEFKKFLISGNVVDMAVGFIFGAAFATEIKSPVSFRDTPLWT